MQKTFNYFQINTFTLNKSLLLCYGFYKNQTESFFVQFFNGFHESLIVMDVDLKLSAMKKK